MNDLVTELSFKPPRLSQGTGKLHTIATFVIGYLVEIRALISEDITGAACLLWPSVVCRGGCRVKTVRLCEIEDRDAVEKTILDAYRAGRKTGELPGMATEGKGDVSRPEKFSLKDFLDGVRKGGDFNEEWLRLSPRDFVRVFGVVQKLAGIGSNPIPARDSEILGVFERQIVNKEISERRKQKRLAAKAVVPRVVVRVVERPNRASKIREDRDAPDSGEYQISPGEGKQ